MSRSSQSLTHEVRERWPFLHQFLGCYLNQDWPDDFATPQVAVAAAVAGSPLENRQQVARDWWDWNRTLGKVDDIRKSVDAMGVCVSFRKSIDARNFMNDVYDQLIVSIRREAGKGWKP